jgi:hypothetical protein
VTMSMFYYTSPKIIEPGVLPALTVKDVHENKVASFERGRPMVTTFGNLMRWSGVPSLDSVNPNCIGVVDGQHCSYRVSGIHVVLQVDCTNVHEWNRCKFSLRTYC